MMKASEARQHAAQAGRGNLRSLETLLKALVDGEIKTPLGTEGGTGIVGSAQTYETQVEKIGDLIRTTILIDLTGLNSGGAAGDIIGLAATANCHIGQYNAALSGTLVAGSVLCLETPAGGATDIDLYSATEATGTEDTAITGLTETQLSNGGAHVGGDRDVLTTLPADGEYLYLVSQAIADATYTAGKLLIELWGKPA